jgi:hypothetical protein
MRTPTIQSVWIHSKTLGAYKVTSVGRAERDGTWMLGYVHIGVAIRQVVEGREVWVISHDEVEDLTHTFYREVSEWYDQVAVRGALVQRFVPADGESSTEREEWGSWPVRPTNYHVRVLEDAFAFEKIEEAVLVMAHNMPDRSNGPALRCRGCGYYGDDPEMKKECDAGSGGHNLVEVDDDGKAL